MLIRWVVALLIGCFFHLGIDVLAQDPAHYRINESRGLSHSTVYSILQSDDGMMWLGTNGGLIRYNTRDFSRYSSSKQKGRAVSYLCEDAKGRIWCSNFSGQIFHTEEDSLVVFAPWSSYHKDGWASIAIDQSGRFLAVNGSGNLVLFDLEENTSKVISTRAVRSTTPFFSRDGDLYFTDERGIALVLVHELEKGMVQIATTLSTDSKLMTNASSLDVCLVFRDKDGYCIQEKNDKWRVCNEGWNSLQIYTASVVSNDQLYVATSSGLQVWKWREDHWDYFATWFEDEKTNDFIIDQNENVWISTLNDGVIVVNNTQVFQLNEAYETMLLDKNNMWIASTRSGELHWLNERMNIVLKRKELPLRSEVEWMLRDEYSDDILFSQSGTTYQLNKTGKIVEHPFLTKGYKRLVFPGSNVYGAATTFNALLLYETKSTCDSVFGFPFTKQQYRQKAICQCQLYPDRATDILYDQPTKTFWILTPDGLFYNTSGQLNSFKYPEPITAIAYDEKQVIAVTRSGVLLAIHPASKQFEVIDYSGVQPISANILIASPTEYLLNGEKGITRINKKSRHSVLFNMAKGLVSNEINAMRVVGDTLIAMTRKGIQIQTLTNEERAPALFPPKVMVSHIIDGEGRKQRISDVLLAPGVSTLDIFLECANWTRPGDYTYRYTIEGLDSRWIEVNASTDRISLAFLPPGNYVFRIKAVSLSEGEGEEFKIPISVLEFWYQTLAFKIALSLLGLILITLVFLWQLRRMRIRNERERTLSRLAIQKAELESALQVSKLNSIKAQMNPHFIFNALNSIQEMIFRDDKFSSSEYLGKFADLMRLILSFSHREFIALNEEIEMLRLYLELEGLRFGQTFSFAINSTVEDGDDVYLPPMIIQPFAENAMKHGLLHKKTARHLEIRFEHTHAGLIEVIIDDNGVGRDYVEMIKVNRNPRHNSFATGATAERLKLFSAQYGEDVGVEIIDKKQGIVAIGTRVILRIPIKNRLSI